MRTGLHNLPYMRGKSNEVSIRMGAFDDDPGIRPQFHTFVESRAPWDIITDDLPQYPAAWSRDAIPRDAAAK